MFSSHGNARVCDKRNENSFNEWLHVLTYKAEKKGINDNNIAI